MSIIRILQCMIMLYNVYCQDTIIKGDHLPGQITVAMIIDPIDPAKSDRVHTMGISHAKTLLQVRIWIDNILGLLYFIFTFQYPYFPKVLNIVSIRLESNISFMFLFLLLL